MALELPLWPFGMDVIIPGWTAVNSHSRRPPLAQVRPSGVPASPGVCCTFPLHFSPFEGGDAGQFFFRTCLPSASDRILNFTPFEGGMLAIFFVASFFGLNGLQYYHI